MNIRLHVLCVHLHDSEEAFGAVARACREFTLSFVLTFTLFRASDGFQDETCET